MKKEDITEGLLYPQSVVDQLHSQLRERDERISSLEAEARGAQKRQDELAANVAQAFRQLVNISLLTHLGGEVDDYADVKKAVDERISSLEAERDEARELVRMASGFEGRYDDKINLFHAIWRWDA